MLTFSILFSFYVLLESNRLHTGLRVSLTPTLRTQACKSNPDLLGSEPFSVSKEASLVFALLVLYHPCSFPSLDPHCRESSDMSLGHIPSARTTSHGNSGLLNSQIPVPGNSSLFTPRTPDLVRNLALPTRKPCWLLTAWMKPKDTLGPRRPP